MERGRGEEDEYTTQARTTSAKSNKKLHDQRSLHHSSLAGVIHLFFEGTTSTSTNSSSKSTRQKTNNISTGYFAINHRSMGSLQDVFGQLWKEYALSDSRYLTQDPFVLCMETITAVRLPSQRPTTSHLFPRHPILPLNNQPSITHTNAHSPTPTHPN